MVISKAQVNLVILPHRLTPPTINKLPLNINVSRVDDDVLDKTMVLRMVKYKCYSNEDRYDYKR